MSLFGLEVEINTLIQADIWVCRLFFLASVPPQSAGIEIFKNFGTYRNSVVLFGVQQKCTTQTQVNVSSALGGFKLIKKLLVVLRLQ